MIGRILNNKVTLLLLVFTCLVVPTSLPAVSEQPRVILVSDKEEAYSAPIASFTDQIKQPVEIYNLKGNVEKAPGIMK